MREFLFRGQTRRYGEILANVSGDKLPGKWVYGGLFWGTGDFSVIYGGADEENLKKHLVYSDTVGQYTGLQDRTKWDELYLEEQNRWLEHHSAEEWNGRSIYEGDIVEGVAYSSTWRGVIVWIEKIAGFGVRYQKRTEPTAWENASILKCLHIRKDQFAAKVIGNIHDTPELMNEYGSTGNSHLLS